MGGTGEGCGSSIRGCPTRGTVRRTPPGQASVPAVRAVRATNTFPGRGSGLAGGLAGAFPAAGLLLGAGMLLVASPTNQPTVQSQGQPG